MTNIDIHIVSDIVCPWCYIGFTNLTQAINLHKTLHPHDTFTLTWSACYLYPSAPAYPGIAKITHCLSKYSVEDLATWRSAGASSGAEFNFGGMTGSTRDFHRLLWWIGEKERLVGSEGIGLYSLQARVVADLFRGYFACEKNITDTEVLVQAAVDVGLRRKEVEAFLCSGRGGEEVDEQAGYASRSLREGVPHYLVQGRYVVRGAEGLKTFVDLFRQVRLEELYLYYLNAGEEDEEDMSDGKDEDDESDNDNEDEDGKNEDEDDDYDLLI